MGTYHGDARKYAKRLSNRAARKNKLKESQNIHRAYKRILSAFDTDYKAWSHNTKPRYKTRGKQSIRYPADNQKIPPRYRGPAYEMV